MLSHHCFIVKPTMMKVCIKNIELFQARKKVSCLALDLDFSFLAVELVPTLGVISLRSPPGPASHSTGSFCGKNVPNPILKIVPSLALPTKTK